MMNVGLIVGSCVAYLIEIFRVWDGGMDRCRATGSL